MFVDIPLPSGGGGGARGGGGEGGRGGLIVFEDIPLPSGHSRPSDWLADKSGWSLLRSSQPANLVLKLSSCVLTQLLSLILL